MATKLWPTVSKEPKLVAPKRKVQRPEMPTTIRLEVEHFPKRIKIPWLGWAIIKTIRVKGALKGSDSMQYLSLNRSNKKVVNTK